MPRVFFFVMQRPHPNMVHNVPIYLSFKAYAFSFRLIFAMLLIGAAVLAYWPAFYSEPIWDDHFLVGQNPFFRSPVLVVEAFRHWLYPFSDSTYFRPVQNVSYIVDYWFWSTNLFGYHLTNALLHAAAALLLASLIRRIASALVPGRPARNKLLAAGVGIIWLAHPIHHAAVAYTAGRADSLAAVFALLGWLLAERGLETRTRRARVGFLVGAVICCALALFSKEIAITWIALFIIYQVFVRPGRPEGLRIAAVVGSSVIVVLYFLYRQTLPYPGEVLSGPAAGPFASRVVQACRAFGDYLSIVLFPVNLHMERQLHVPTETLRSSAPWLYYHALALFPLCVGGLAASFWLCFRRSEDRRLNVFATCWFLVGFLPISNLFPLNAPVAEHWIYMPSAALILILLRGLIEIPVRYRAVRPAMIGVLALVLGFLTHQQSRTWVTEEIMFRTAITRGGDTARAYANLARVLEAKGDFENSEAVIRHALKRNSANPVLKVQLTALLAKSGRTEEALELTRGIDSTAEEERVRPPIPWAPETQQIRLLLTEKKLSESQVVLSDALNRWPQAWDLLYLQALVFAEAGQPERSVQVLGNYVQKNWWHRAAVMSVAQYLAHLQRYDEAVEKYRLAGRLDVHSAKPWEQISAIYFQQGRRSAALAAQENAVRAEPKSAEQRLRLSKLYSALGNEVDALIERQTAADLQRKER